MANMLPESAAIATNELIGFIIYVVVFIPLLFVHPSKLLAYIIYRFAAVVATIVGLFAWAEGNNHGAPTLISSTTPLAKMYKESLAFRGNY